MSLRKRLVFFDLLRLASIIGVLVIHISGWFVNTQQKPLSFYLLLGNLSRWSVPMFVFISAAIFYLQYSREQVNWREFYVSRFRKVAFPYFFSSCLYYLYRLSDFVSDRQHIEFVGFENVLDFFVKLLTTGVFSHFYFIPMILMFYLISPLLVKKTPGYWNLVLLVITNLLFVALMVYFKVPRLYYRWTVFPFLTWVALGLLFGQLYSKFLALSRMHLILIVCLCFGLILSLYNYYYALPFGFVGLLVSYIFDSVAGFVVIGLVHLITPVFLRHHAIVKRISMSVFGIYLLHYLFIDLFFSFYARSKLAVRLDFYVFLCLVLGVPIISIAFENLLRFGRSVFYSWK